MNDPQLGEATLNTEQEEAVPEEQINKAEEFNSEQLNSLSQESLQEQMDDKKSSEDQDLGLDKLDQTQIAVDSTSINEMTNLPQNMPLDNMDPFGTAVEQNIPPIVPPSAMNVTSLPSMPNMMPPGNMGSYPPQIPPYNMPNPYMQPGMLHHQERSMIQQQIAELYTMPPAPEHQEKILRLQERLNIIQQHETTDQCLGSVPTCVLQNPMFSSTMIDSPQVTSTTGRGRGGRGTTKPRKPRVKKGEKAAQISSINEDESLVVPSNLPVSEDSVTAGTGLSDLSQIYSEDHEMADVSQDNLIGDLDTSTDASGKKIKKPRKPRAPRPPKEPKEPKSDKEPRESKESKKKRDKDPDKVKGKKKSSKKPTSVSGFCDNADNSISHDNSTEFSKATSEGEENQTLASLMNQNSTDANSEIAENDEQSKDGQFKMDDEVTDFDDIPVSKIAIKTLLEEKNNEKKDLSNDEGSDDHDSNQEDDSPKKKRPKRGENSFEKRRNRGNNPPKVGRGSRGGKSRKNRGRIVPESDGEADDLVTTPPPSPPADLEIDSNKRRSARNTHRKKYTDDVLMRFSDDESALLSPTTRKEVSEKKEGDEIKKENPDDLNVSTTDAADQTLDLDKTSLSEDLSGKPNYVYINTTDEDTMIVQFVLAQRMGKRELKPEPPVEIKKEPIVDAVQDSEIKEGDSEIKEELKEAEIKPEGEIEKMEVDSEEPVIKPDVVKDPVEIEKDETPEALVPEVPAEIPESENSDETKKPVDKIPEEEKMETEEPVQPEVSLEKSENSKVESEVPEKKLEIEKFGDVEDMIDELKSEKELKEEKPAATEDLKLAEEKEDKSDEPKPEPVFIEVEEFMVKYRNFSYLHCEWRTEDELIKGDKRVSNKIRRFQQKQAQQFNIFENLEEDPFNPDFVETDRILDCSEHTDDDGNTVKHYLVKWKSLPYEDSTWELEEDVDQTKVEQFIKFNKIPPRSEWKFKRRPHPDQWKQLQKTPEYKSNNTLRAYQLEGLNWLKYSWFKGNNCILADEMVGFL